MNHYSALKQALKPHLAWHRARLSVLAMFLLALIKVKTINLSELAVGFGGKSLKESNYKRLQRFFRNFELDYSKIAKIVVGWLKLPQPWLLSLDWTTWKLGEHCYNILTVGIVHEGVAIPLLWWLLKKKGNSNSDERMRFIEAIFKNFPTARIRCLCADREFIGQAWLRHLLLEPSLSLRLRIRATDKIERNGKALSAKVVFAHLAIGESQQLPGDCRVWGNRVSLEALRLEDGDLLIVLAPPHTVGLVSDYALRCGIETLLAFSRLVVFVGNRLILLTPNACVNFLLC